MPGISVTTAVRTGPTGNGDIVAGQWFVVGEAERGDITKPTLCRSFSDYVKFYGDYQAGNLYQYVKTYTWYYNCLKKDIKIVYGMNLDTYLKYLWMVVVMNGEHLI